MLSIISFLQGHTVRHDTVLYYTVASIIRLDRSGSRVQRLFVFPASRPSKSRVTHSSSSGQGVVMPSARRPDGKSPGPLSTVRVTPDSDVELAGHGREGDRLDHNPIPGPSIAYAHKREGRAGTEAPSTHDLTPGDDAGEKCTAFKSQPASVFLAGVQGPSPTSNPEGS
jgi:hypothetical protein